MSVFAHFSRKLITNNIKLESPTSLIKKYTIYVRCLNHKAIEYDGNPHPAPIFVKKEIQVLLKTLTRIDLHKVYKKRKLGEKYLSQPIIKFMTDKQLEEAMQEIQQKVDDYVQIPPVMAVRKPINRIISEDPALQGLETSKFVFTDITFGMPNSKRLIVVREIDGTLKEAEWAIRDRINQLYFPIAHRQLKLPKMFLDNNLERLLNQKEYEFILDRACLQFEPDDEVYQKVVTITYQYINENNQFESLRSTRHFGSLAFFLSWNKMIDNLLLELLEDSQIEEAQSVVQLYGQIHNIKFEGNPVEIVEQFIQKYADKRGALQLAIQSYKELVKQQEELQRGIRHAHGLS